MGDAPRLQIVHASFGGTDFTEQVNALVTREQQLTFDSAQWQSLYGWTDPWFGTTKTMVVFYRWHGRPAEILVALEGTGVYTLDPKAPVDPSRKKFFNPDPASDASGLKIVAIVWGSGPVGSSVFQTVATSKAFTPSNGFMGVDNNVGIAKTAQVFYLLEKDMGSVDKDEAVRIAAQRESDSSVVLP